MDLAVVIFNHPPTQFLRLGIHHTYTDYILYIYITRNLLSIAYIPYCTQNPVFEIAGLLSDKWTGPPSEGVYSAIVALHNASPKKIADEGPIIT